MSRTIASLCWWAKTPHKAQRRSKMPKIRQTSAWSNRKLKRQALQGKKGTDHIFSLTFISSFVMIFDDELVEYKLEGCSIH
jgi:hypothetical protein